MGSILRKHRKTIELGRAIERAVEEGLQIAKTDVDRVIPILDRLIPLESCPHQKLVWWHQIGSRNPKPLMDELLWWMHELGEWGEPSGPLDGGTAMAFAILGKPDYPTCLKMCKELVYKLNKFFIQIPRFASPGRPKGKTRPKVTPEVKEGVRAWLKARNKKSRCSVSALARKLEVSRSTIYRVIEEIR